MTYFCALWMPSVRHEILKPKSNVENPQEKNITDLGTANWIRVELLDGEHIEITRLKPKTDETRPGVPMDIDNLPPVRMTLMRKSANGMFLYRYEEICGGRYFPLVEEKETEGKTEIVFPLAIYQIIKGFYHEHRHHGKEEDTHLEPYLEKEEFDIQADNNRALVHYLEKYLKKFTLSLEQLRTPYNDIIEKSRSYQNGWILSAKPTEELHAHINKVGKHRLYYNTLYNSKYNTKCRLGVADESNLSRIAFNIENTLAEIDVLSRDVYQKFGLKSTKASYLAAIVSVILGFIGLLLGIGRALDTLA